MLVHRFRGIVIDSVETGLAITKQDQKRTRDMDGGMRAIYPCRLLDYFK